MPDNLEWCIGPPLLDSFKAILNADSMDKPEEALQLYRQYFTEKGIYQNILYPTIPELLQALANLKITLYVATSKPTVYAEKIMTHFHIDHYFKAIYGSELNGIRDDKKQLIAYILKKEKLPNERTIMIGDRKHDLIGAKANNVASIGVIYGYGSCDELNRCHPNYLAESPLNILDYLMQFMQK